MGATEGAYIFLGLLLMRKGRQTIVGPLHKIAGSFHVDSPTVSFSLLEINQDKVDEEDDSRKQSISLGGTLGVGRFYLERAQNFLQVSDCLLLGTQGVNERRVGQSRACVVRESDLPLHVRAMQGGDGHNYVTKIGEVRGQWHQLHEGVCARARRSVDKLWAET